MTGPSSDGDVVISELLPEHRPGWEIQIGWEIRMDDGEWKRVTGRIEAHSKVPDRDDAVVLLPDYDAQCAVEASELVMSRYTPGPPARIRDLTAAEVDQVKADFLRQPQN